MVSNASPAIATSRPRKTRTHSQPTLWGVATVFFLLGSAATTLTIWQLHKLYRATVAPIITVEGTLKARYSYNEKGSNPTPAPQGYYIDSPGIGRVYLTNKPLDGYVGQAIKANGSVSGVCGPKSIPCYPLIEVREVSQLIQE